MNYLVEECAFSGVVDCDNYPDAGGNTEELGAILKKLNEIPLASVECCEDEADESSLQVALARRLEKEGHQTIAVGRAIMTIERVDEKSETSLELGWAPLKISIYPDPDVTGDETPVQLYLDGGRYGLAGAFLEITQGGQLFELEQKKIQGKSFSRRPR